MDYGSQVMMMMMMMMMMMTTTMIMMTITVHSLSVYRKPMSWGVSVYDCLYTRLGSVPSRPVLTDWSPLTLRLCVVTVTRES